MQDHGSRRDASAQRYLGLMQEQSRNMQRLVDDLLTLSALESEQNPPVDTTFAVAPLPVARSAPQARALSAGRHTIVAVLTRADSARHGELARAKSSRAHSAISFPTRCAIRRMAARSRCPGSSMPDGRGCFAVADTVRGIAGEHLPRLTEQLLPRGSQPLAGNGRHRTWVLRSSIMSCCGTRPSLRSKASRARGSTFTAIRRRRCACSVLRPPPRSHTAGGRYQYLSAARNSASRSSRPTSFGALRITRYCGSAPVASASI